jgi:hypothetical protein
MKRRKSDFGLFFGLTVAFGRFRRHLSQTARHLLPVLLLFSDTKHQPSGTRGMGNSRRPLTDNTQTGVA